VPEKSGYVAQKRWWAGRMAVVALVAAMVPGASVAVRAENCPTTSGALAGTTRIQGNSPGAIDVTLPADATVATPFDSSPDLNVSGQGRLVGLVLRGADGTTLLGARFPEKDGAQFLMPVPAYPAPGGNFEWIKFYADETTLPAGNYTLYLLADGAPVDITLRLHGLEGCTTVLPTRPAEYKLSFPPPRLLGGAGAVNNVYSAAESNRFADDGLAFQALWIRADMYAAGQYFFCYRPGTPNAEAIDNGPGCLDSENMSFSNDRPLHLSSDTMLLMEGLAPLAKGDHRIGFWYSTESVVTDLHYATLWLTY
jgi:hypothetical protein